MKEQERIVELINMGVISAEEGLSLLEKIADEKKADSFATKKTAVNETEDQSFSDIKLEIEAIKLQISELETELVQEMYHLPEQAELKAEKEEELTELQLTLTELEEELNESAEEKIMSGIKGNKSFFSEDAEKSLEDEEPLSQRIGGFFKAMTESVSAHDLKRSLSPKANSSFKHEFYYPEIKATNIDFKVANGNIMFNTWDKEDVKVEATIKLYGKMEAETDLEAFLQRSRIEVNDETINFQLPNKRVKADLNIFIPSRVYDHVSINLLNGDMDLSDLKTNDCFIKSTNGDKTFNAISATMLEIEGVNGNVLLADASINDIMVETVNGNANLAGTFQTVTAKATNGDLRLMPTTSELKNVDVRVKNGTIKVAIPEKQSVEAYLKTDFGSINHRVGESEIIREKKDKTSSQIQLRRTLESEAVHLRLSSTTGSIYIKDKSI